MGLLLSRIGSSIRSNFSKQVFAVIPQSCTSWLAFTFGSGKILLIIILFVLGASKNYWTKIFVVCFKALKRICSFSCLWTLKYDRRHRAALKSILAYSFDECRLIFCAYSKHFFTSSIPFFPYRLRLQLRLFRSVSVQVLVIPYSCSTDFIIIIHVSVTQVYWFSNAIDICQVFTFPFTFGW